MNDARYHHTLGADQLRSLPGEQQRQVMESWFRSRYEDPAEGTPYDSEEGGYVWISGGPYDAQDELRGEFEGIVPDEVIAQLADHLSGESPEWAPVASEDDYDPFLLDVVSWNSNALPTIEEALATVRRLLELSDDKTLAEALNRLLYANVITALETYMSDTFINRVLTDSAHLRRFIETTPDFQKRSLKYSDVFRAADDAADEAKRYLLDVVWHNLARAQALYRDTLGIDIRPKLPDVVKAVPMRHDIVHRNGRDKSGVVVMVSPEEVRELIGAVEDLVHDIERQLKIKPNVDSDF